MAITISRYAACVNNLAAFNALLKDGLTADLFQPPKFPDKAESDFWIYSQIRPHFYTSLPTISLRDAGQTGLIYNGRRLGRWETAAVGADLGPPEPLEREAGAEAKSCSARFFLEGSEFDILDREFRAQKPRRTGHLESTLVEWVIDLSDSVYALYSSVTIELLMVLYGSYRLHMEIERCCHDSRTGWNSLTEFHCQQIAERVQARLNHEVDRLSLLLPSDHVLIGLDPSPFGAVWPSPRVNTPDDIGNSVLQQPSIGLADNATTTPPNGGQELDRTESVRSGERQRLDKRNAAKGRPKKYSEDMKRKAAALKQEGRSWRKIHEQLLPGEKRERAHEKFADAVRQYQKRSASKTGTTHRND